LHTHTTLSCVITVIDEILSNKFIPNVWFFGKAIWFCPDKLSSNIYAKYPIGTFIDEMASSIPRAIIVVLSCVPSTSDAGHRPVSSALYKKAMLCTYGPNFSCMPITRSSTPSNNGFIPPDVPSQPIAPPLATHDFELEQYISIRST